MTTTGDKTMTTTTQMQISQAMISRASVILSRKLVSRIQAGETVQAAMDGIFGEGVGDQFVTALYHKLRGEEYTPVSIPAGAR